MAIHLEHDLENLQHDILLLAASVEESIHKSIRACRNATPNWRRK